jgi:hypothetical protein
MIHVPYKWGELGGGLSLPPPPINSNTHTAAGHVWYIKLPMYLFYMELGRNDFEEGCIHYSGYWKGWALKISNGPKWHLLRSWSLKGPISLDFQGPPLPMALETDVAHIKIILSAPYEQQVQ